MTGGPVLCITLLTAQVTSTRSERERERERERGRERPKQDVS